MKIIVFLLTLISLLYSAHPIEKLIYDYKKRDYQSVCINGIRYFSKLKKDEDLLTMYAFSCLYIDRIDRLYLPTMILGKTKESRQNKTYFSLIIAQKNILLSAFFDNKTYENINIPYTNYVISRVFNLYVHKRYKKLGGTYMMHDSYGNYKVYVKYINKKKWLIIEEDKDGKTLIHQYR